MGLGVGAGTGSGPHSMWGPSYTTEDIDKITDVYELDKIRGVLNEQVLSIRAQLATRGHTHNMTAAEYLDWRGRALSAAEFKAKTLRHAKQRCIMLKRALREELPGGESFIGTAIRMLGIIKRLSCETGAFLTDDEVSTIEVAETYLDELKYPAGFDDSDPARQEIVAAASKPMPQEAMIRSARKGGRQLYDCRYEVVYYAYAKDERAARQYLRQAVDDDPLTFESVYVMRVDPNRAVVDDGWDKTSVVYSAEDLTIEEALNRVRSGDNE